MTDILSAYPAIRCRNVTRIFKLPHRRQRVAVEHLDLEVPSGGVFGFLGVNGAGKTTTIKMLLGFLRPTEGKLEIFGESCSDHTTRRHVGYVPEQPSFHPFLSPQEVLRVHCELIGLDRMDARDEIDEALELTRLTHNRDLPLQKLSKGNQQRVGIAQALLGSPRLLILDEPTSGLDPVGRHEIQQIIRSLAGGGRTVFLSSHVLAEVESLCDRVGILSQGRLAACGPPDEIREGGNGVRIVTTALTPPAESRLREMGARVTLESHIVIEVAPDQVFQVVRLLEEHGLPLVSVLPVAETLESAFLRLAA